MRDAFTTRGRVGKARASGVTVPAVAIVLLLRALPASAHPPETGVARNVDQLLLILP